MRRKKNETDSIRNFPEKKKQIPVKRIGTHKKSVTLLWIVLIGSVAFGVYKNFTAVDKHTVREEIRIETKIVDTNAVENFVKNFTTVFYSWENNKESIASRSELLQKYMTKELQDMNTDMIKSDALNSSYVTQVDIWGVEKKEEDFYRVYYSVEQNIVEDKERKAVKESYMTLVYVDNWGDMVIVQNPTAWKAPGKSEYEPDLKVNSETIDSDTINSATKFLETLFKQYPWATEEELIYFAKEGALRPIDRNYAYVSLVNPVFIQDEGGLRVSLGVKYMDQDMNTVQIPQYNLLLVRQEKSKNWLIEASE